MLKLKPRQVIGLVAIVVFGGILIVRLTQPSERQIMEQRLASLPSPTYTPPELPALDLSTTTVPPLDLSAPAPAGTSGPIYDYPGAPDYLNVGSQPAKDDMYCAGVLNAEFHAVTATAHPDVMSMLLRDHQALDAAGIAKLVAEGAATEANAAGFTLAYGDKAEADYAAKSLRIPVATCSARAAALN